MKNILSKVTLISQILLPLLFVFMFSSCSTNSDREKSVVIAIPTDVNTFSPLYAMNVYEGNITEQIFLGLAGHRWLENEGAIESFPLLAESWEWNRDSNYVLVDLREDVYWSDSVQFTAEDVIFSYTVYSNADVQSRFYGSFENYFTNEDLSIDIEKSFELIAQNKIRINFKPGSHPSVFDFDFPIIPKHKYEEIAYKDFMTAKQNLEPVGTGPFELASRKRDETIILGLRENSFLSNEESIPRLIFKIVPDYKSRLIQLETGEVDFVDEIKPEDIEEVKSYENIAIAFQEGRDYDYIGWNNIDAESFRSEKIEPNKLFGSADVRRALTYAINRELIVREFLNNYGEVAFGPVSRIFQKEFNHDIEPFPFNPTKAESILTAEGWKDTDKDGILEKGSDEFSFTLSIPGGNPRRSNTATIIKENLKNIGIEVEVETLEPSLFFNKMFGKQLEAWIAGWSVPIPLDLKPYWHSDLETNFANVASFQNAEIDNLLEEIYSEAPNHIEKLKEVQKILHEEQPVTFLFWIDNIVAYNNKLQNVKINPLGSVQKCWEWRWEN